MAEYTSDCWGGNTPFSLPPGWGVAEASTEEDEFDDSDGEGEDKVWGESFGGFIASWVNDKRAEEEPDGELAQICLSEFTKLAFRMPTVGAKGEVEYAPFSFEGRRHMEHIYDSPARRKLLSCARQVEKSTLLGNIIVALSCLIPGFRALYVSPTSTQTKVFSNDRIKEPIQTSEVLSAFTTTMLSENIFEKQFVNYAKITLRNAFLNADRTRGIPSWMLALDEFQDLLSDNIPIIEQSTSHAPEEYKKFIYAGTPKSLDNNLEFYRSGYTPDGRAMSTQGEWMVPCDACGNKDSYRYWNILGEKNIGKKGLICERCGELINPQHADAQWAVHDANGIFESYRIPQLMVPWKSWEEILLDYGRYPRDKFHNEVLGLSYDSGMRPLNQAHVKACCDERVSMHPDELEKYKPGGLDNPIFAGIDWGSGENTYTVLSLGRYIDGKFRIFYIHRFTGQELEPVLQMKLILDIINDFGVFLVGADYGGGFTQNDAITREIGPLRLAKFQYMARCKKKVEYEPKLRRYKVFRTEVMSDIFNAIKRRQILFPRWEEFREPYATDMCSIVASYNETLRMLQYNHRQDKPDDSFHSVLYCFLVSMVKFPRHDIISPLHHSFPQGPGASDWGSPGYQG